MIIELLLSLSLSLSTSFLYFPPSLPPFSSPTAVPTEKAIYLTQPPTPLHLQHLGARLSNVSPFSTFFDKLHQYPEFT